MSRVGFNTVEDDTHDIWYEDSLDELIANYIFNKSEFDSYKELVDSENLEIKKRMKAQGLTEYSVNDNTVKYVVSKKEIWDDIKLIQAVKKHNISTAIKIREYVDTDELERVLYNMEEIPEDLISDIDACKIIKEIVSLRIGKERKNVRE